MDHFGRLGRARVTRGTKDLNWLNRGFLQGPNQGVLASARPDNQYSSHVFKGRMLPFCKDPVKQGVF